MDYQKIDAERRKSSKFPLLLCLTTIALMCFIIKSRSDTPSPIVPTVTALRGVPMLVEQSHDCVVEKIKEMSPEQLWANLETVVLGCTCRDKLNVITIRNMDERKFYLEPTRTENGNRTKEFDRSCTFVSIGIGRDVEAEKKMKKRYPQCQFHGADPVDNINNDLYSPIGTFNNVAVGGSMGVLETEVLLEDSHSSYVKKNVTAVDLYYFLDKHVNRPIIDNLLIDIEHAEYDLFPLLAKEKTGEFRICQMNIEVHEPDVLEKEKFHRFVNKLHEDGFTLFTARFVSIHYRVHIVNYRDAWCRDRYLQ